MKKSTLFWCLALVAVALVSSGLTRLFYANRGGQMSAPASSAHDMAVIDWDETEPPIDLQAADTDEKILDASKLPSQLSGLHLPDVEAVRKPREEVQTADEEEEMRAPKAAPLHLKDNQNVVVPLGGVPSTAEASEDTARVLIPAPVRYKLINTLDEYKNFKRTARGSYPEVNFAANRVLVLESDSELPDNLFEIVDVTREGEKVLVTYRVNVIGLNERTNTHSVKVLKKSNREIELKQVL